jgi:hypothetical protein
VNGKLLAQLAVLFQRESDKITDSYAWPPRPPLSEEERKEAERLRVTASRVFLRAAAKGWGSCGTDELFGGSPR